MACFQKRSGSWRAIIKRKGYPTQTRTFDLKGQAETWAKQIENEMDRGVFVSRVEAECTTLAELLDRYENEITPQKRGAAMERSHLKEEALAKTTTTPQARASRYRPCGIYAGPGRTIPTRRGGWDCRSAIAP